MALRALQLNARQLCTVELLGNTGFHPLTGPMNKAQFDGTCEKMRLPTGEVFGLPVVFDWDESLDVGGTYTLKQDDLAVAEFKVSDKWKQRKDLECQALYKNTSITHPSVRKVMSRKDWYYGGEIKALAKPKRIMNCMSPAEVKEMNKDLNIVAAFQCRNPLHRAHYALVLYALNSVLGGKTPEEAKAAVLVHPTIGPTQDDDIDGVTRYRTYQRLQEEFPNPGLRWAYLPYSMHMAGPREALQHMRMRKNFGATHFIIGRDMAGGKDSISGDDFNGAYDAQEMAAEYAKDIGIDLIKSMDLVYTVEKGYIPKDEATAAGLKILKLSGTAFRKSLRAGEDIPDWFAFPCVVEELRKTIK